MNELLYIGLITIGALLLGTLVLHLLPKLGGGGRAIMDWFSVAPGLDLVVAYFTALPMIVGPILAGWAGLGVSVAAQVLSLLIWSWLHGWAHPTARKGPRIVKVLNDLVWCPAELRRTLGNHDRRADVLGGAACRDLCVSLPCLDCSVPPDTHKASGWQCRATSLTALSDTT